MQMMTTFIPSKSEVTSNPRGGGTLSSRIFPESWVICSRSNNSSRYISKCFCNLVNLSTQETQKFSSSFFAVVFSQAKIHGAIVLHVFNCDVTLGFNCHQDQSDHKTRAFLCFLAISQSAKSEASLSQSSSGTQSYAEHCCRQTNRRLVSWAAARHEHFNT